MKKLLPLIALILLAVPLLSARGDESEDLSKKIAYYEIRYQIACRDYDTTDARCFWNKVEYVHAKEVLGRSDIGDYLTGDELDRITKKIGFLESRYAQFCTDAATPASFCTSLGKLVEKGNYFMTNDQKYAATESAGYYDVTKVVDGDTISVSMDGKTETVRMIGLDTPETVDPRKTVQCFGVEASDKAKSLLTGKKVRLVADASQGERDKYGRLLRYVFMEDGTNFNKLMIEEGYGHEYTYNIPYQYQAEFQQAEADAELDGRGLWAADACAEGTDSVELKEGADEPDVSGYSCGGNLYNCTEDFTTHDEAQSVYDKCMTEVGSDVHQLDADDDGEACESLP